MGQGKNHGRTASKKEMQFEISRRIIISAVLLLVSMLIVKAIGLENYTFFGYLILFSLLAILEEIIYRNCFKK